MEPFASGDREALARLGREILHRATSLSATTARLVPTPHQPLARPALTGSFARPLGLGRPNSPGDPSGPSPGGTSGDASPGVTTLLDLLPREAAAGPPLVLMRVRRRLVPPPPPVQKENPDDLRRLRAILGDPSTRLPDQPRAELEPMVGSPLDDVRLHTGPAAGATATKLGAAAFTVGRDIFFGPGRFEPQSARGRAMLAHELVHARQQADGARPGDATAGAAEREAEAVERHVLAAAQPGGPRLRVDQLTRNYRTSDGSALAAREVARLDALSARALRVCDRLLGADAAQSARDLGAIRVDVALDLDRMTDDEAAEVWGMALARAIHTRGAT